MVSEYSIVVGNKVVNRIVSDRKFAEDLAEKMGGTATDSRDAKKGFIKQNERFVPPPEKQNPDTLKSLIIMLMEKGILNKSDIDSLSR
jgi:hypothetical protein